MVLVRMHILAMIAEELTAAVRYVKLPRCLHGLVPSLCDIWKLYIAGSIDAIYTNRLACSVATNWHCFILH